MTSLGTFLYTGDFTGCIKVRIKATHACSSLRHDSFPPPEVELLALWGHAQVWDLAGGACTQTITDAHTHVVSQMMNWEENGVQYIISSSYDGTIRVWAHEEAMAPGAVLKPTPIFTYPDSQLEDPSSFRSHRLCMILDMMGQLDGAGQPVLVTSHGDEQLARMFGLPAFDERGVLPRITDARAICAGPNGLMFCGLHNGLIRVFQLQPAA